MKRKKIKRELILRFSGITAEGHLKIRADDEQEITRFMDQLKNGRKYEVHAVARKVVLLIHPEG